MKSDTEAIFVARLQDPLSTPTRSVRRNLLGTGFASIVIVRLGLIPTKVSALGIELDPGDQRNLLIVLAVAVVYFSISFVSYGLPDYLAVRLAANLKEGADLSDAMDGPDHAPDEFEYLYEQRSAWLASSNRMLRARIVVEFFLPLCVSVISLGVLVVALCTQ